MTARPKDAPKDRRGRYRPYIRGGHKKPKRGRVWNRFVKEMLGRAGFRCEQCGRTAQDLPLQVHHLWPLSAGGPLIPRFPDCPNTGVRVLCSRCHYATRAPKRVADWMNMLDEWYPPGE